MDVTCKVTAHGCVFLLAVYSFCLELDINIGHYFTYFIAYIDLEKTPVLQGHNYHQFFSICCLALGVVRVRNVFKMHRIQEHQEVSWLPNTLCLVSYWPLSQATPPVFLYKPAFRTVVEEACKNWEG